MTENRINIMMDPEIPTLVKSNADNKPEGPQVVYASMAERFVALLIDYGCVYIPAQLLARIPLRMLGDDLKLWQFFAILAGINFLFILYEAIFSCGDRVTLGKSLVGIAVVKQDLSGPISFPRAFLRAVGYYISAALLMCGFLLSFFEERHRALHDFLGGSVVVQIRQKAAWERWAVRALGGLLLVAFAWTVYTQYLGGGDFARQYYINQAHKHLQKIAILEETHHNLYGYYTNDLKRLALLSGDPVRFRRDTQAALEPKGFQLGVQGEHYKIRALAKDEKHTPVMFESGK